MRRYISNYVVLADGTILYNHIISVDGNDTLISIEPIDGELAYTQYVPDPIVVCHRADVIYLTSLFHDSRNLAELCAALTEHQFKAIIPDEKTVLLQACFDENYISEIQ